MSPPEVSGEASSNPALDLTERQLGEFRLLRRLGKGGMAEVYLADQTSLNRQVAVKVLRPEFLTDENYVKRFRREAAAAGGLNHPNIVQVYMIGQEQGIEFIAQEYVQGRNLREFMKKKGPLDVLVALVILRQVAAALQVAGQAGIVHRDIKPENIMLTKKGEAKVADFGLAQLSLQGERVALTQAGVTMGTPLYMSPEQVGGKPVDHRSDLYSFGVMAYHMLAGKPPFTGDTALAIAVQHLNEPAPPLQQLRSDLPAAVCDLVDRLLSKDRENRPQDAQTVLSEIKRIQRQITGKDQETELPAVIAATKTSSRPALFQRPLKAQIPWLVGCCFLLAAASAGAGWMMRTPDPLAVPPQPSPATRRVPLYDSIQQQEFYAISHGDDRAAWQAVIDSPQASKAKAVVAHAQLRLAMIDLRDGRFENARRLFEEFSLSDDGWQRAHGDAGLAYLAWRDRNDREAERFLQKAQASYDKLNAEMRRLLDDLKPQ